MEWFKINYLKPGAEQMGKMIHLVWTLLLHISPDSPCLCGSCCTAHKKLTCQWTWHLGLACHPVTPLPLRSEEEAPLSPSAPLTVTIHIEKAIPYQWGQKKAAAMQVAEVWSLGYSLEIKC